jgi:PadR family transcriptional regulator, regulatory protein PadR
MSSAPLREPTYFILTALAGGPAHGYRLLQLIEQLSDGRVRLRAGTLYAALDRLERDGYITLDSTEVEGGPPRRSFVLTPSGRELLQAEVDRLQANAAVGLARLRQGLTT